MMLLLTFIICNKKLKKLILFNKQKCKFQYGIIISLGHLHVNFNDL